jgi:hypothetical protein
MSRKSGKTNRERKKNKPRGKNIYNKKHIRIQQAKNNSKKK